MPQGSARVAGITTMLAVRALGRDAGALLVYAFTWLFPCVLLHWPRRVVAAPVALAAAWAYGALAG